MSIEQGLDLGVGVGVDRESADRLGRIGGGFLGTSASALLEFPKQLWQGRNGRRESPWC